MVSGQRQEDLFSKQLENWLASKSPKTFSGLSKVFKEKSFALFFLILLAIPALPIPTGGVTHVFEIIAMLLALELIAGRRTIWLPKKWRDYKISTRLQKSMFPTLIRWIRFAEKYSKPRLNDLLEHRDVLRFVGLIIFTLTLSAFLAPPFSGLDTLPALGVVIISLSMIFGDALLFIFGLVCGTVGIALVLAIGTVAFKLL